MKVKCKSFLDWDEEKKKAAHDLAKRGILYPYFVGRQRDLYKLWHTMRPKSEACALLSRKQGKSFTALLLQFELCLQKPGSITRHIFPTQKMSRDVVLPMLNELSQLLPSTCMPHSVNRSEGTVRFANGSMIALGGMNPEAVENNRGSICDALVLDEIGFCEPNWDTIKYGLYSVLYPQLTLSKEGRIFFITTPSSSPSHPFMTEILPPIVTADQFVTYNIYDSPFLSQDDLDQIIRRYGGVDSLDFRREYLCESIPDQNKIICPEFVENRHVVEETPKEESSWMVYLGVDLGLVDNSAFISSYYDHNRNKLVVFGEHFCRGKSLAQLAGVFRKEWEKASLYSYDSDHMKMVVDVFEIAAHTLRVDHGLRFVRPVKRKVEDSIGLLRKWLAEDRVEISKSCPNLIRELKYTEWDDNKTVNKDIARTSSGHGDGLMALCYLVWQVNRNYRPGLGSISQLEKLVGGY